MRNIPSPRHVRKIDIVAGLAYIASGGLSAAFALGGPRWILGGAAVTGTAGLLMRLFANPTDKPATAIVENAPVVPANTQPMDVTKSAIGTNAHT